MATNLRFNLHAQAARAQIRQQVPPQKEGLRKWIGRFLGLTPEPAQNVRPNGVDRYQGMPYSKAAPQMLQSKLSGRPLKNDLSAYDPYSLAFLDELSRSV